MRKSEMSVNQIAERQKIIDYLAKANWENEHTTDWFEEDLWAHVEAEMSFDNGRMLLVVKYSAAKEKLYLKLEDPVEGGITLTLNYDDNLEKVLAKIVEIQTEVNKNNFREYIGLLLSVCPKIYTYVGEDNDQLAEIVDEKYLDLG